MRIADHLWRSATPDRLVLSRCWGHWIAISLNSRSFCCCQHHNTHNINLIDGPSDDAVRRGRGFWLQACGRSPACFKVVTPPAQSLRVHQKSVLNVLWCWTLDIAKELVQMTQHHAQHLAGWCCDHAGICTCGWDRLLVRALSICAERNLLCSICGPN